MLFVGIPHHKTQFVTGVVDIGNGKAEFSSHLLRSLDVDSGRQQAFAGIFNHGFVFNLDTVRRIDDPPGGFAEVIRIDRDFGGVRNGSGCGKGEKYFFHDLFPCLVFLE